LNNSKRNRILSVLKYFIVIFPSGLLFELIISSHKINILRSFLISLGFSVGISFGDMFLKEMNSDNEMSESEKFNYSCLSLFMGILSIPSFPLIIASVLGIICAVPVLKSSKNKIALVGVILSSLGLILAVIFYSSCLYAQIVKRN